MWFYPAGLTPRSTIQPLSFMLQANIKGTIAGYQHEKLVDSALNTQ